MDELLQNLEVTALLHLSFHFPLQCITASCQTTHEVIHGYKYQTTHTFLTASDVQDIVNSSIISNSDFGYSEMSSSRIMFCPLRFCDLHLLPCISQLQHVWASTVWVERLPCALLLIWLLFSLCYHFYFCLFSSCVLARLYSSGSNSEQYFPLSFSQVSNDVKMSVQHNKASTVELHVWPKKEIKTHKSHWINFRLMFCFRQTLSETNHTSGSLSTWTEQKWKQHICFCTIFFSWTQKTCMWRRVWMRASLSVS